jgi:hypothetical protein
MLGRVTENNLTAMEQDRHAGNKRNTPKPLSWLLIKAPLLRMVTLSEHWSNARGPIRGADAMETAGVTGSSADRSWRGWSA